MSEEQQDMFGIDPDMDEATAIRELSRAIDPCKWEGTLGELQEATVQALERVIGPERAREIAPEVVMSQADRVGGGLLYFPKATEMRRALRDAQIAELSIDRGWSIDQLRERFDLTAQSVYAILARQKALRRRAEPDLFGFKQGGKG